MSDSEREAAARWMVTGVVGEVPAGLDCVSVVRLAASIVNRGVTAEEAVLSALLVELAP